MFHVPEKYRMVTGRMGSTSAMGNNGCFVVPSPFGYNRTLFIIASDGMDWDHVSVHASKGKEEYTPIWDEMVFIKNLFWDEEDCVIQYHPAKSSYVNVHKHTLHLWRPTKIGFPVPPLVMV